MQYALVNGKKSLATSGARAICPTCGADMVAKCGPRVIHHWAHSRRKDCDPWWENETPWHREWKEKFPEECREVSHIDSAGEIHRADIKTPTGIVIEVQHSTLSEVERKSRELFYQNLVWIVDGIKYRRNFHLGCILPDPSVELFQDIVWHQLNRSAYRWFPKSEYESTPCYSKMSEISKFYPGITKSDLRHSQQLVIQVYDGKDLEEEVRNHYNGHHQFYWTRPRQMWLDAKCPVYLDFGEEVLYKLDTYDETGLKCVRLVSKQKLIQDAMVESNAENIAIGSCFVLEP